METRDRGGDTEGGWRSRFSLLKLPQLECLQPFIFVFLGQRNKWQQKESRKISPVCYNLSLYFQAVHGRSSETHSVNRLLPNRSPLRCISSSPSKLLYSRSYETCIVNSFNSMEVIKKPNQKKKKNYVNEPENSCFFLNAPSNLLTVCSHRKHLKRMKKTCGESAVMESPCMAAFPARSSTRFSPRLFDELIFFSRPFWALFSDPGSS